MMIRELMRRYIWCTTVMMLIVLVANGQQDVQFSQYMLNSTYFNAASAGLDGNTSISAIHRSQWLGYNSDFDNDGVAPTSQLLSFATPLNFNNMPMGVGFNFINDRLGVINNLHLQASLAYHKQLRRGRLSIGLQPALILHSVDFTKFNPVDPDDPILQNPEKRTQLAPDLSIGVMYSTKVYFLGASVNHLLSPSFDFGLDLPNSRLVNKLEITTNLMAGYNYQLAYNLVLSPTVLVKTDLNTYSFDLSVIGTYDDKIWGGVSYRDREALILLMGYSFLEDNVMKVGYAFDYVVDSQNAKSPTSHEIFIRYNLPNIPTSGKKIIRTPRFRF